VSYQTSGPYLYASFMINATLLLQKEWISATNMNNIRGETHQHVLSNRQQKAHCSGRTPQRTAKVISLISPQNSQNAGQNTSSKYAARVHNTCLFHFVRNWLILGIWVIFNHKFSIETFLQKVLSGSFKLNSFCHF